MCDLDLKSEIPDSCVGMDVLKKDDTYVFCPRAKLGVLESLTSQFLQLFFSSSKGWHFDW